MPELPEVEVLVRHLQPLLNGKRIRRIQVCRAKVLGPTSTQHFQKSLSGATFRDISRRGKYLLFSLRKPGSAHPLLLLGHLGMTGRMYLSPSTNPLPKHAAVTFGLGRENFVFEDTRYFGKLTLDVGAIGRLGPEPLGKAFTAPAFSQALQRSQQPIKVKLLDQSLVAGVGNIYASEALFRAGISPALPANQLTETQVRRLWRAIRQVLREAIRGGSTVPLNISGVGSSDGLFYFGRRPETAESYEERLRVYDRAGQPCPLCGQAIQRLVQAARSTYWCPGCQPETRSAASVYSCR